MDEPRIVEITGFNFDFAPSKHMVVAENEDKPGIIGRCCIALGDNQINISTMQVSCHPDNKAMMIMTVSDRVDKKPLETIAEVRGISKVKYLQL